VALSRLSTLLCIEVHIVQLQQLIGDSQLTITCAALEALCDLWGVEGGYMMGAMLVSMLDHPFFTRCAVYYSFFQCTCVFLSCEAQASSLRPHQSSTKSEEHSKSKTLHSSSIAVVLLRCLSDHPNSPILSSDMRKLWPQPAQFSSAFGGTKACDQLSSLTWTPSPSVPCASPHQSAVNSQLQLFSPEPA
jgi:hypothetical protein